MSCRIITAVGLAGLLAGNGTAQKVDPTAFSPLEEKILGCKANLDRHAALELCLAHLRGLRLRAAEAGVDARAGALAEYIALLAAKFATGFADPRRIDAAFAEVEATGFAAGHPVFRDTLTLQRLQILSSLGQVEKSARLRQELGFLDDWWLLGPFDNERGSGFDRILTPEKKWEPAGVYPGKKRDVRWRRLPVTALSGFVNLRATVRPTTQVLCYAATALHSDEARDVVLRLGSAEAFKVFLNGSEVGRRDVRRRFQFDQEAIVLPLRGGHNLLVLKVCTQEGSLGFSCRLRGLTGQALRGVRALHGAGDLALAGAQRPRAGPASNVAATIAAKFALGARTAFQGAGAADAYRLASVLTHYRSEDHRSRRITDLLKVAVDGLDRHPAALYGLATSRIRKTASAAEKEENRRRHDYESLLAKHPDHVETRFALAIMDLTSVGAAERAEKHLEKALALRPDAPQLHEAWGRMLRMIDVDPLALRAEQRAARADAAGNWLVTARRRLASRLLREGRLLEAEEVLRALHERRHSTLDTRNLAGVLLRTGRRDAAVKLLRAGIATFPFRSTLRARLSRLLEAEGDVQGAMQLLLESLKTCPEDDNTLVELSRLHGLLGQTDQQREFLRTAVELNPNRKRERRHLEFLEAEERPFYHEYQVDSATVLAADRGAPPDSARANDPYYYLFDQRVVLAYRNGTASEYRHFIVRILNEEGARRFARYAVSYYRGEQRARLLGIRIVKKSGEVMQPRLRGSAATLPPLGPGDVVDVRYRIDDTMPGFFGDYFGFEHMFAHSTPVQRSSLVVVLDRGREYSLQVENGAPQPVREKDKKGRTVWRFAMRDLSRPADEESQPTDTENRPLVRITTYESWDAFASWWSNLIKNQSQVSPAMRKKIAELTAGSTKIRDKIDAIYRFVTTDVRYEAWEFGVHGYKPYSTPVIFERRHGDCKDKSLLLNAMLSVIGVQAYPVLIRAADPRSKDDLSLPLVSHFNHCISYLPPTGQTAGMFLDGTATYHPHDTLPTSDYGADVLVVHGGEGRILTIPWPEPPANRVRTTYRIALRQNGDADVTFELRPTRNEAVWVRDYLGNEPAKRRERLERIIKRDFGAVEIQSHRVSDLADLNAPVTVVVKFVAQGFAQKQGKGLVLESAIGAEPLSRWAIAKQRTTPLLLGTPRSEHQTITYRLPAGYQPLNLPGPVRLEHPFGSFELTWNRDGGSLVVKRQLALGVHRIAPRLYPAFREFVNRVDQASRQVVVIEKRGR